MCLMMPTELSILFLTPNKFTLMKKVLFSFLVLANFAIAQTPRINFKAPLLYPEGVAYDPKSNLFYISSVITGTIGSVDEQGNYKEVYSNKDLKSSFGIKVDMQNNLLWVCIADPNFSKFADSVTHKKMSRVIAIDLTTKSKTKDIDLAALIPGKHFANDLTTDNKGNLYITDSFSPVIYKVDKQSKATIFAQSDLFKSDDLGLNGIAWHPDGYLLAAHNTNGVIFKIEIANPAKITRVIIPSFFPGADGFLINQKKNLILVQNKGVNKIFELSSTDQWTTAKIISATAAADRFANPTTATYKKDQLYILNSKMNELQDSTMGFSKEFSLQLAVLKPVK